MMDEREDRLDAVLRDAAREYNPPPATPRAELWERIAAARQAGTKPSVVVKPFTARPSFRLGLGIAALLALGVAIGRFTAPRTPVAPTASQHGAQVAATPAGTDSAARTTEGGSVAAQLITVQHLGQVESFLTEFSATQAAQDFSGQAQELLSTTRLLLDSKRLTDVGVRKLLEDLELVLVQIATLNPNGRREELGFITDGLSQNQLRTRIRNAIPTGPAAKI